MLIFRMGLGACRFGLYPWLWPIPHVCISATNRHLDYPRCKAHNCWCSFNKHFQDPAVTVALSLMPMKATNILVMHNSNHMTVELPYLQDRKSLTLHWHSFYCIIHWQSASIDDCIHNYLTSLVAFQADWDWALWQSRAKEYSWTGGTHSVKT